MDQTAYEALHHRAAWIDLSGRGKIRATGDDRVRLLHAMCTNNIEQLQPGTGCYAFFLTAQGRIIADANVFYMPDYLLIDTEPETRQRVIEHLDKYIIADDVTLHDFTDAEGTIGLEGPAAREIVESMGAEPAHIPLSIVEWGRSQVAHASYSGGPGYLIFFPTEDRDSLVEGLSAVGVPQADLATADVVRIENRRPRYGVDFNEANIPQETRQMQAVHFSKGCYLGQEIVERVRSRGHVNRMLAAIEVDTQQPPAPGTKIESGGDDVGQVTSAALSPARGKVVGLGLLRAEAAQTELSVAGQRIIAVAAPAPAAR